MYFLTREAALQRVRNGLEECTKTCWPFLSTRCHLKDTVSRRLRAEGISLEDRYDLSGQKSPEIAICKSTPELENLTNGGS